MLADFRMVLRGDPREIFLRAYAKEVKGLGAVKARLAEALPLCWEKIPETLFEISRDQCLTASRQ